MPVVSQSWGLSSTLTPIAPRGIALVGPSLRLHAETPGCPGLPVRSKQKPPWLQQLVRSACCLQSLPRRPVESSWLPSIRILLSANSLWAALSVPGPQQDPELPQPSCSASLFITEPNSTPSRPSLFFFKGAKQNLEPFAARLMRPVLGS